jgi:hypothetical protein
LLAIIADEKDDRLPVDARASLIVLAAQLQALQTVIGAIEKRIIVQHRASEESKRVANLPCPGGNTTGFALYEYGIGTKWLELRSCRKRRFFPSLLPPARGSNNPHSNRPCVRGDGAIPFRSSPA